MREVLRPVAKELGLEPIRGDETASDPEKIEEIYNYIAHSKVLVADLYHLPSVFLLEERINCITVLRRLACRGESTLPL